MKGLGNFIFYFLAVAVASYVVLAYALFPLGAVVHPDMKLIYLAHKAGIYTHVFACSIALLLGPLQFSTRFRQRYKHLHRWIGGTYLGIGVVLGGVSGLYMSAFAFGGSAGKLGFACLALAWLYTGGRALHAIRHGSVAEHRKWMVRNFALTFAAVTLRIYVPSAMISGIPFATSYPFITWLCWVPNLLVAEVFFNRESNTASTNL